MASTSVNQPNTAPSNVFASTGQGTHPRVMVLPAPSPVHTKKLVQTKLQTATPGQEEYGRDNEFNIEHATKAQKIYSNKWDRKRSHGDGNFTCQSFLCLPSIQEKVMASRTAPLNKLKTKNRAHTLKSVLRNSKRRRGGGSFSKKAVASNDVSAARAFTQVPRNEVSPALSELNGVHRSNNLDDRRDTVFDKPDSRLTPLHKNSSKFRFSTTDKVSPGTPRASNSFREVGFQGEESHMEAADTLSSDTGHESIKITEYKENEQNCLTVSTTQKNYFSLLRNLLQEAVIDTLNMREDTGSSITFGGENVADLMKHLLFVEGNKPSDSFTDEKVDSGVDRNFATCTYNPGSIIFSNPQITHDRVGNAGCTYPNNDESWKLGSTKQATGVDVLTGRFCMNGGIDPLVQTLQCPSPALRADILGQYPQPFCQSKKQEQRVHFSPEHLRFSRSPEHFGSRTRISDKLLMDHPCSPTRSMNMPLHDWDESLDGERMENPLSPLSGNWDEERVPDDPMSKDSCMRKASIKEGRIESDFGGTRHPARSNGSLASWSGSNLLSKEIFNPGYNGPHADVLLVQSDDHILQPLDNGSSDDRADEDWVQQDVMTRIDFFSDISRSVSPVSESLRLSTSIAPESTALAPALGRFEFEGSDEDLMDERDWETAGAWTSVGMSTISDVRRGQNEPAASEVPTTPELDVSTMDGDEDLISYHTQRESATQTSFLLDSLEGRHPEPSGLSECSHSQFPSLSEVDDWQYTDIAPVHRRWMDVNLGPIVQYNVAGGGCTCDAPGPHIHPAHPFSRYDLSERSDIEAWTWDTSSS